MPFVVLTSCIMARKQGDLLRASSGNTSLKGYLTNSKRVFLVFYYMEIYMSPVTMFELLDCQLHAFNFVLYPFQGASHHLFPGDATVSRRMILFQKYRRICTYIYLNIKAVNIKNLHKPENTNNN